MNLIQSKPLIKQTFPYCIAIMVLVGGFLCVCVVLVFNDFRKVNISVAILLKKIFFVYSI